MTDYPECQKLSAHSAERNAIVQFLSWAAEEGMHLMICDGTGEFGGDYRSVHESHERLAHRYLEIDEEKLEAERRAMLEEIRSTNGS